MQLLGLQLHIEGATMSLRSRSTRGAVHKFKSEDEADMSGWSDAFWAHAGFCEEMRDMMQAKKSGKEVMNQLSELNSVRSSVDEAPARGGRVLRIMSDPE